MESSLHSETLVTLCQRHLHWIEQPLPLGLSYFQQNRLVNNITSLQISLLRFHHEDEQAMQLFQQLDSLAKQDLTASELQVQLLAMLREEK